MKFQRKNVYYGDLYRCTSFPTVASNYFIDYGYSEEAVLQGEIFIKLKDGSFATLKNLKKSGGFLAQSKERGDYFVKNLKAVYESDLDGKVSVSDIREDVFNLVNSGDESSL